ncbi:hypothetical protein TorRG33x02_197430, partial [Trema orientale]
LLYASRYHHIRTVVNVSGRYDLKRGIVERLGEDFMQRLKEKGYIDTKDRKNVRYCVTEESMTDRLNTDMQAACLQIDKECRLLKWSCISRIIKLIMCSCSFKKCGSLE